MVRVIEPSDRALFHKTIFPMMRVLGSLFVLVILVSAMGCGGSTSPSTDTSATVDSSSCNPGSALSGDEACSACNAEQCFCLADNTWQGAGAACSASCEPGTQVSGDDACAACECDDCICLADKSWKCLGASCETTTSCEPGETKDADDGCNTCNCDSTGEWQCTANTCGECVPGDQKTTNDGCNDCFCNSDANWECGDDPCACDAGAQKPAEDGCNTCECTDSGQWTCTNDPCGECSPGDTKTAADGCSQCTCTNNSTWSCDSSSCSGCPPAKAHECALKETWAQGPNGDCCEYDSPCARPDESWPTFDTEAECKGEEPTGCTPGSSQPAGDGCNTCNCTNDGEWACTEEVCGGCTPGEITSDACNSCTCTDNATLDCSNNDCNTCGVPWVAKVCEAQDSWAREPNTGICCFYAKPCWVPMGYEIFDTQQLCEEGPVVEPVCLAGDTDPNPSCPDKQNANCTCNAQGTGFSCPACPVCDPGQMNPNPTCPTKTEFNCSCNAQGSGYDCPTCPPEPICSQADGVQPNPSCADQFPSVACSCSADGMTQTCAPCQICTPFEKTPIPGCSVGGYSGAQLVDLTVNMGEGFDCTCSGDGLTLSCDECPECVQPNQPVLNPACEFTSYCDCSMSFNLNCASPCPECLSGSPPPPGSGPQCECNNGFWQNCEPEGGCPDTWTMTDAECGMSQSLWVKTVEDECCEYDNPCSQPMPEVMEAQNLGGPFFSLSECESGSAGCPNIESFCNLDCCNAGNGWGNCVMEGGCKTCNCEGTGGGDQCQPSPDGSLPSGSIGQTVSAGCVVCTCVQGATGPDWSCDDNCESCSAGDWKLAPDGCNSCECVNGFYSCSSFPCTPGECAPPAMGCGAIEGGYGLSPAGDCCPYDCPNAVPDSENMGYLKFFELDACEEANCALTGKDC